MSNSKLYEYAILWHPTKEQKEDGKKSEVVVKPTTVLAPGDGVAQMIAVKAIPDKYAEEFDQIDIVIRPF